jgi:hypothetical protein
VDQLYKIRTTRSIKRIVFIVETNFHNWASALQKDKQDDLADAFLQGLWYFKNRNIITYADDLKINSVSIT